MTQPWQAEGPRGAESSHPAEAAAGTFRARRMISGKGVLPPALPRPQIPASLQISVFPEKSLHARAGGGGRGGHLLGTGFPTILPRSWGEQFSNHFSASCLPQVSRLLRSLPCHAWNWQHHSTGTVPSSLEAACTEVPRHFQGRENITERRCLAEGSTPTQPESWR